MYFELSGIILRACPQLCPAQQNNITSPDTGGHSGCTPEKRRAVFHGRRAKMYHGIATAYSGALLYNARCAVTLGVRGVDASEGGCRLKQKYEAPLCATHTAVPYSVTGKIDVAVVALGLLFRALHIWSKVIREFP